MLHIAPEGRLRATLSDLDRLDYHCTEPVDGAPGSLELGFVAWSFDVVICDGDKATGERRLPLREILRAAASNPEWHGMACVMTVVVAENGRDLLHPPRPSFLQTPGRPGVEMDALVTEQPLVGSVLNQRVAEPEGVR